jgi:hypothetical protein
MNTLEATNTFLFMTRAASAIVRGINEIIKGLEAVSAQRSRM